MCQQPLITVFLITVSCHRDKWSDRTCQVTGTPSSVIRHRTGCSHSTRAA